MHKDKRIILIGAAGGFGQALTSQLARGGVKLALGDRDGVDLETQSAAARDAGSPQVQSSAINVTDESSVSAFFANAGSAFGGADVLIYLPGLSVASSVATMAEADYDKIVDVNLKGLFLCAKHFLPLTKPENNPLITFISSQAATRANPNAPVYCAAKAAVSMFGQGLALQVMKDNVRVTAIKPGPVNTQGFWGDRPVPREKFMQVEDVARVIDFVLSLPPSIVMHEVSFESFEFFRK
jgi:NAD(P)-dependent dehydrogenase (short-subunit alcohol dehydrogenase family)